MSSFELANPCTPSAFYDYLVSFSHDSHEAWWLDWFAPALSMSFHLFGAARFFDPFVQAGLGCAGRVRLGPPVGYWSAEGMPYISLFPFIGGGVALNLDGFLLGARMAYTPFESPIPATPLPAYPLGQFQVTLAGGFPINW
ncbi:MAG: hypothetical protein NTU62_12995 [Spirochaetes bacterium]|nr:hypothetical protein [Spirochaetota bacterium]